jgi:proline dehydrogenase
VSASLVAIRQFFQTLDADGRGVLTAEEWHAGFAEHFHTDGGDEARRAEVTELFERFARPVEGEDGKPVVGGLRVVDYVEFTKNLTLQDLPRLVSRCRTVGPLARSALDATELELVAAMHDRLQLLVETAQSLGVRLMVDAEQTYFQPAIDALVLEMQRRYNRPAEEGGDGAGYPVVFNTYQCYLRDALPRLRTDTERARRDGFFFAAKLVRGAYMVAERRLAAEQGRESPIHSTLARTHETYHASVVHALRCVTEEGANIMLATHNQDSVELALAQMDAHRIDPRTGGVYFGQLLGMADHLTFTLGQSGFSAYKYVPYGPVHEVMPYLVRRAQENSDVLGGVEKERQLYWEELKRRLLPGRS